MLEWIKQRFFPDRSPMYTAISRGHRGDAPATLLERETSAEHEANVGTSQARWREAPLRPADDAPLVTLITGPGGGAFVTLELPEGRCLPLFTSPFRAMDYAAVRLRQTWRVPVTVSSAADLARATPSLIAGGVTSVTVDTCPRCTVLLSMGIEMPDVAGHGHHRLFHCARQQRCQARTVSGLCRRMRALRGLGAGTGRRAGGRGTRRCRGSSRPLADRPGRHQRAQRRGVQGGPAPAAIARVANLVFTSRRRLESTHGNPRLPATVRKGLIRGHQGRQAESARSPPRF